MKRRNAMHRVAGLAVVALCSLTHPLRAQYSNLEIPTAADGYSISISKETSTDAPAGYSGRIENIDHLAVGREPNVIGRTYKSHFTLANEIRNCPRADGTSEGDGEFTVSGVFTHTVGSTTYSSTYAMTAKAKYKGKVGDDGFLDGPVTADIDYTYTIAPAPSPRIDPISPLATSIAQHITIQFQVPHGKGFEGPVIGAFGGGDPTKGQLNQANGMGLILAYWGGVWYTFAQLNWMSPGKCVQVVFDPPSFSRQPVPGSNVKVLAYIKTNGGEGVRGKFPEVTPFNPTSESVAITSSATDPGSPAYFTYTAPNKKLPHMGFGVSATSRGGNARGNWETGLGTDWSGQITVSKISPGVDQQSDLITAHHYEAERITINVQNGEGTADGFSEVHGFGENRHYVADGNGKSHIEVSAYDTDEGMVQGQVKATAGVQLDTLTHHYTVMVNFAAPFPTGRRSRSSCTRGKCTSQDDAFSVGSILTPMGGNFTDPNHVSGSLDLGKPLFPGASPTAGSYLITWDLSRIGTTK
jgi:hypothetical protein